MLDRIDNSGRSISKLELSKVCSEIGLEFPADYKAFLLQYNGGSPEPDAFPIKRHEEEVGTVQIFFGIAREIDSSGLKWNYDEYKDRIPNSHLPIACSDTNDLICLVLSKDQYGSVVFWDAEVADSFTHFLKLLFED